MLRGNTEARNFTFTAFYDTPPRYDEALHSYMCYQKEEAPKTKKLHWQGFVQYINKTRKSYAKLCKEIGCDHIEKSKGTAEDNRKYCSKTESAIKDTFKEFGKIEQQGQRNDIKAAVEAKSMKDIDETTLVKYHKGLQFVRNLKAKKRNHQTELYIYWGDSCTGKSRKVHEETKGEAYWKNPANKWWCCYDGEEDIVIDDVRENHFSLTEWLRLCDRYPLMLETKGGQVNFIAKRIFITSNDNPLEWFGRDAAWLRRIKTIEHVVAG